MVSWAGDRPDALGEQLLGAAVHHGSRTTHWAGPNAFLGVRSRDDPTAGIAVAPGPLVCVADGRLDNRSELAAALGVDDASDPGLLLHGFQRWGHGLAHRVYGDFTLAVWSPTERALYLARDPFGARPLYYSSTSRRFAAASEVEQLLALGVDERPDDGAILNYLTDAPCDPGATLFSVVRRLQPGHWLRVQGGRIEERRYWAPPFGVAAGQTRGESEALFRQRFRDAVARRLTGPRPVVVQLSGGLDSSSIVCVAGEIRRNGHPPLSPVYLSSASYPGLPCDESAYIEAVLAQAEFPHDFWDGTAAAPLAREQPCVGHPWAGADPASLEGDFRLARQVGARAVVSGFGGDELLFEAGVFRELAEQRRWAELLRQVVLGVSYSTRSRWSFLREALAPHVPGGIRRRLRGRRGPNVPEPPPWLSKRLQALWREAANVPSPSKPTLGGATAQQTWDWLTRPALSRAVELQALRAARQGLEMRFPFLDRGLAECVLSLPVDHRLPDGRMKQLLRRSLADLLPKAIAERKAATTFTPVVAQIFRKNQPELERFLAQPEWRASRYVDRGRILDLFRGMSQNLGKMWGPAETEAALSLVDSLQLERWLRTVAARKLPLVPGVADEPRKRPLDARTD